MSIDTRLHPGLNLHRTDPEAHLRAVEPLFGFWVFLMSDAVIFALLFVTYAVLLSGTAGGPGPAEIYRLSGVALETAILLTSSVTFGMASLSMKYGLGVRRLLAWLVVTLLLGLGFLGLEMHDFVTMINAGAGPSRSGFLSSYFTLVSTHGLHVLAGCVWLVVMMVQIVRFGFDRQTKTGLLCLGLFWHFLDIVWVGLFSLIFLQGLIG